MDGAGGMMRAFVAVGGLVLTCVGLILTFSTWTVDGWTVLAGVGVGLLLLDQRLDERGSHEH
jgi:hypothetical protein